MLLLVLGCRKKKWRCEDEEKMISVRKEEKVTVWGMHRRVGGSRVKKQISRWG